VIVARPMSNPVTTALVADVVAPPAISTLFGEMLTVAGSLLARAITSPPASAGAANATALSSTG
jgi:hypothetical protein